MATAMLNDRGLRRKMTEEKAPRGTKRKPSARRQEQNNNIKRQRTSSEDPKTDMLSIYQPWVIQTYGDLAKTKTITIKKYARILRTLRGEEVVSADNSKFRFWVKAKGFHVGKPAGYDAKPADAIIGRYSVCDADTGIPALGEKLTGSAKDPPLYVPNAPFKNANGEAVYRKVAVVENFFDIIYNVHVELEGRPGKHAGQKRTYRTITETYAFLPREAVTRFLLGCTECQRRPRSPSPATAALPPSLPTPSQSPTLPLPPAAAPRALTDRGPAAPPPQPSLPAAQPPVVIHVHQHQSCSDQHQTSLNLTSTPTKIDTPIRTSTPSHPEQTTPKSKPLEEPKRSSNPLDVCNLTSRNSPPPQSPTTPIPAKICTPPKKRHLNSQSERPKLWSPVESIASEQRESRRSFLEGEIDYSLPITTTYLKYMRSLGCTDEDALQFEKTVSDLLPFFYNYIEFIKYTLYYNYFNYHMMHR